MLCCESVLIRCNDKATISARISLVCLTHRPYHCTVFLCIVTIWANKKFNDDDDDDDDDLQPAGDVTLLVRRQKGHPACKKTGCWFVGGDDLTGALHDLQLRLTPPLPSSLAPINPEWRHSGTG